MDVVSLKHESVQLSLKAESGKVKLVVSHGMDGVDSCLSVAIDSDHFLDKLAKAIPGQVDDAVISMLKAALKA